MKVTIYTTFYNDKGFQIDLFTEHGKHHIGYFLDINSINLMLKQDIYPGLEVLENSKKEPGHTRIIHREV